MAFQGTGKPAHSNLAPVRYRRAVEPTRPACGQPPFDQRLETLGSVAKRFVITKEKHSFE